MYPKLLMNGFVIDHESVRLILKELDPHELEKRTRDSLTRRTYISTGSNQTCYIDGCVKLRPFGFAINGAMDDNSGKII